MVTTTNEYMGVSELLEGTCPLPRPSPSQRLSSVDTRDSNIVSFNTCVVGLMIIMIIA